jgi:hypothetical protein
MLSGRLTQRVERGDDNRKVCSLYLGIMAHIGVKVDIGVKLDRFGDSERRLTDL